MLQVVDRLSSVPCRTQSRQTQCSEGLSVRAAQIRHLLGASQGKPFQEKAPALRRARRLTVLRWARPATCGVTADPSLAIKSSQSDGSETRSNLTGSRAQDRRQLSGWRVAKVVLLVMTCVWLVQAAPGMAKAVTASPSTGSLTFGDALKGARASSLCSADCISFLP